MNNATATLSRQSMIGLMAALVLSVLPHTMRVPIWVSLSHFILVGVRLLPVYSPLLSLPTTGGIVRVVKWLLTGAALIGIYFSYGTLVGRDAGTALLIMLAALKLFECENERDFYIICYMGYLLVITHCFYSQTVATSVYICFVVVAMTVVLISFNDKQQSLAVSLRFRLAGGLLLQAFPIMLVMFLLFPRINGPLWGLPKDVHVGVTGVDDEMSIGSISKLTQSSQVAFRVKFEDDIPDLNLLYWRGPVLSHTDGRKWTAGRSARGGAGRIDYLGDRIDYEVTLEATNKHWLFAIEMPARPPAGSYFTRDRQLRSRKRVQRQTIYQIRSYTDFKNDAARSADLRRALALPEGKHKRTVALANSWAAPGQTPEQIIRRGLNYFLDRDFVYTLQPVLLTGDPVDDFLFSTKQGFCEHYAAGFTVLMRAAGLPARVVTGYQGGEVNPVGNYLIVRQYHAHAWSEVWLDDRGWVRIDPTSVVSPARINDGLEYAVPESVLSMPLGLENNVVAAGIWRRLQNSWDAIDYQWTQWVSRYGPDRQEALLARLGFEAVNWKTLGLGMVISVSLVLLAGALWIFKGRPTPVDPADRLYLKFCRRLAKTGVTKNSSESPNAYARRALPLSRGLEADILAVTGTYMDIRYGSQRHKLSRLKRLVAKFLALTRV